MTRRSRNNQTRPTKSGRAAMAQAATACRHQNRSCLHVVPQSSTSVFRERARERSFLRVRFDKGPWRSRNTNNANYKTEYERRDLRLSFSAEIIACECTISFPGVSFDNSFSHHI